jgi:hypothetical protein
MNFAFGSVKQEPDVLYPVEHWMGWNRYLLFYSARTIHAYKVWQTFSQRFRLFSDASLTLSISLKLYTARISGSLN